LSVQEQLRTDAQAQLFIADVIDAMSNRKEMNMAISLEVRPAAGADYRAQSKFRTFGLVAGVAGLMLVMVALIGNIVAGNESGVDAARIGAWTFGLTTAGFSVLKTGIALTLIGILARLWFRVDSLKQALPALKPASNAPVAWASATMTSFGKALVSNGEPKPLLIHRMAKRLWPPMLVMGVMAVFAGFIVSMAQTGEVRSDPQFATELSAWVQGLQFLGEGLILAGISFLLGTILGSLRKGGGEVQKATGVAVKTLKMPVTGKLFTGLMVLGMMLAIGQFVVYLAVSTFSDPQTIASYFAWLGPVREAALGLLLSGIVLALVTIAKVLAFQFSRVTEIVSVGH
jgi:hypothetical protein